MADALAFRMETKREEEKLKELVGAQSSRSVAAAEAIDAVAGAAAGAALGVLGGPVGMAAGAALGAVAGAVLGHVTAEDDREAREIENDLDSIDAEDEFFHERNSLRPAEPKAGDKG
jgi:phage tail tape-measure protein